MNGADKRLHCLSLPAHAADPVPSPVGAQAYMPGKLTVMLESSTYPFSHML